MSKKVKADVTGLMEKPLKGWEKRAKKLAKPEHFLVSIGILPTLTHGLSASESERLRKKLELVRQVSGIMCAGMVKGTIKYKTDGYSLEKWVAHLIGEGADQMNYQILLADAFHRGVK